MDTTEPDGSLGTDGAGVDTTATGGTDVVEVEVGGDGDTEAEDEAGSGSEPGGSSEPPDELAVPADGSALAAAIVEAELAVRDSTLPADVRRSWGRRQQALYQHLSANPAWAPALESIEDSTIRDAANLNWQARQSLSSLLATEEVHAELPAWRVAEPLPPDTLLGYYKEAEAQTGIPWEYVAGINLVETRMGRIQGISTAGAVGPMQFLPTTWAECCEGDPTNPADAIVGAAVYLTVRGGPENMSKALWGYNNSDYYVNAVSAYAEVLSADENAYFGYHGWEIFFLTTEGLVRLPIGYEQAEPVAAIDWLAANPDSLFTPGT